MMRHFVNILVFALFFSFPGAVLAALPAVLDGQKMPSLAPMLEQTTPAVVNIATRSTKVLPGNPLMEDPFFRRFFDFPEQPRKKSTQSLGSGVIVDAAKGLIITNHHVIDGADEITVTLNDGRELRADLMGKDTQADIAVIQVRADGLTALQWADSGQLRVGDFVVAIGNPFGLGQTVTSGIVSALGRSGLGIEDFEDFIQTDASINPGNSGGALVDLEGKLIGINTAILGTSGGNIGIGFAIPSNMAQQILTQLLKFGEVRRGRLGISSQNLTPELARAFSINHNNGVVIVDVIPGSSADRAGLRRGDVVTKVGGRPVKNADGVRNIMGLMLVGQKIELEIVRQGKKKTVTAVVDASDDRISGKSLSPLLEGAVFINAETRGGRPYVEISEVEPGSAMADYGLREGDIILSANRESVADINDFREAVSLDKNTVLLNVQRGRNAYYVLIQ